MIPLKSAKWRDLKRVFASFGISTSEGKSSGHKRKRHPMLMDSAGNKYPIPARRDGDDIPRTYIEGARRKFRLTPEYGISDEDFYGRF
jgi:hypothetical protein